MDLKKRVFNKEIKPPEQISKRLVSNSKTEMYLFANWLLTKKKKCLKKNQKKQSCLKIAAVNIVLFSNAEL